MGLLSKAIRVFHASPHKFDKVNIRPNLGRGEGAQVYGNGFYVAEAEPTMQSYYDIFKSMTGPRTFLGEPVDVVWNDAIRERWPKFYDSLSPHDKERFETIIGNLSTSNPHADDLKNFRENIKLDRPMLRLFENKIAPHLVDPPPPEAHRYELDAATDDTRLLNWDKMLGDQPDEIFDAVSPQLQRQREIMAAARKRSLDKGVDWRGRPLTDARIEELSKPLRDLDEHTGKDVYRFMGATNDAGIAAKDEKEAYQLAADRLMAAGIDGTKYLDQFSRSGGKGTHNYAIWNDDILHILRRYGIPIGSAAAVGGLLSRLNAQPEIDA